MGGLISLLRDIKTLYKDLKVTLKLTARIVLKVHGIVDDVEQTVQELKAAVKGLSSKINPQDGTGEVCFDALVDNVESKAILLKTSLIEATSQVFNEDLLRNTQEKWDKVIQYSRQSRAAMANIVANSSFNINRHETSDSEQANLMGDHILPSDIKEEDNVEKEKDNVEENGNNFNNNRALVPILERCPNNTIEEDPEIRDFEILDTFWKCDIGCFNIDCVDFQQLPTGRQTNSKVASMTRKKKAKKRNKNGRKSKFGKKAASLASSDHAPAKYHHNHNKEGQPRGNVALELIFLIAVLVEGVAMSNSDVVTRGCTLGERNYSRFSHAADIIELDD